MYLNDEKIVGATTYWAVFDTQLRKAQSLALPHEHFKSFPENKATEKSFSRINVARDTKKVKKHKVVLSDLDIVNHVNNVKYLEWCLDTLEAQHLLSQKIKSFDMNFLRELSLHEIVELRSNMECIPSYFCVIYEGKNCFALELEWK